MKRSSHVYFIYADCERETSFLDWKTAGYNVSGTYNDKVRGVVIQVYCDMVTDGSGRTLSSPALLFYCTSGLTWSVVIQAIRDTINWYRVAIN